MRPILSHPDKLLKDHVKEVQHVAKLILSQHCTSPITIDLIRETVTLHDIGKATVTFQDYIRDPMHWHGDPMDKSHTPLGFIIATKLGEINKKELTWFLIVCFSILGHHSGMPCRAEVIEKLQDDKWSDVLDTQLESFPFKKCEQIMGINLNKLKTNISQRYLFNCYQLWAEIFEHIDEIIKYDIEKMVQIRLFVQFCLSILLEADKVYLTLSEYGLEKYRTNFNKKLGLELIEQYLLKQPSTPINKVRNQVRKDALELVELNTEKKVFTLTVPTGLGKTLTAASIALLRKKAGAKKIIIVLPFLTIIEQTNKVYKDFLDNPGTSVLMESHSLSDYKYEDTEDKDAEFLLDIWQSEIVITTFDQFLLALLSSQTKHQMRFHNLADSVIILDEIQAMPTHLWDIVDKAIYNMTTLFNTTVIAMSATQPGFVSNAFELTKDKKTLYKQFNRYRIILKHKEPMEIEEFCLQILGRTSELSNKRVLITVNTRKSAKKIFDELKEWPRKVYFLSADVTPKDRSKVVELIKNVNEPCLVISTQVVEAGVDIDMDHVIRDFAPLDSIVQIAGRCNRNGKKGCCDVELIYLVEDLNVPKNKQKSYASSVYRNAKGGPDLSLQETINVLEPFKEVYESSISVLCEEYFTRLSEKKNTGHMLTHKWASFKEDLDVSQLLRGDSSQQYAFIVSERDENEIDLLQLVDEALSTKDRWERRSKLRQLSSRLSQITVNVWAKSGFTPSLIADRKGPYWFLRKGYYDCQKGLDLGKLNLALII